MIEPNMICVKCEGIPKIVVGDAGPIGNVYRYECEDCGDTPTPWYGNSNSCALAWDECQEAQLSGGQEGKG